MSIKSNGPVKIVSICRTSRFLHSIFHLAKEISKFDVGYKFKKFKFQQFDDAYASEQ